MYGLWTRNKINPLVQGGYDCELEVIQKITWSQSSWDWEAFQLKISREIERKRVNNGQNDARKRSQGRKARRLANHRRKKANIRE